MRDKDRWGEPDWDMGEPVEVEGREFRSGSALTVVLLGGCLIGLVVAIWHLAG